MKERLIKICQKTNDNRKIALIDELNLSNIKFEDYDNMDIVCNCDSKDVVLLTAHYDVVPNSFGYNDNGMSLLIILNLIKKLPNNVQVVFTNLEELGGIGADHYLKKTNKNIRGCINLDVCGVGNHVYCDNYCYSISPNDCTFGSMPFCDGNIFAEVVPTITFSTSYKDMSFEDGINKILPTMHCRKDDNKIELINFDLINLVSDKVLEAVTLF